MSMLDDKSNMIPLLNSKLVRESEKAYLIQWKEGERQFEKWIPKSKANKNSVNQYCIPQWLYDKLISE